MIESLNLLRDRVKFRVRMAWALRDAPPADRASTAELDHLVARQAAQWQTQPALTGDAARQVMLELNDRSISVFVLSIRGTRVRIWDKPSVARLRQTNRTLYEHHLPYLCRAKLYQSFIGQALRHTQSSLSLDFVIDLDDLAPESVDVPVFCFQRRQGTRNPLLPDVDFFHGKWYCGQRDLHPYENKSNSAVFVGSSTGGWSDAEAIRLHKFERLRAANYFHGHPHVIFRIAQAVQCANEEARALLMTQPYFSSYISWDQQLHHRFLISMDGNGAACSRLVKGLLSNSVLVKYASPHELYYFPALEAGRDYLLAEHDADVERFIAIEAATPGTFKPIAIAGRQFAQRYLTIHSVMDYTGRLLRAFAEIQRSAQTASG